ncbi:hypothetical protein TcCL_ESM09191 [Trypanosoma cruzi]|nr:hypothetical protein TcCL_ESM09191 [Trypanosoma cruzi]
MRLIDTSISVCTSPPLQGRPCHAAVSRGWAQELVRPITSCDPFCLVGCVHTALHHGGEAIAPCPAPTHLHSLGVRHGDSCTASLGPRASTKDTSVHLAANLALLRRIIGFRAPTQHERLTRLRYIEDVRGAIRLETAPLPILGKAATTISLPGDAVLNGLRRVRRRMEISPDRIRAPHAEHRVVVWGTVSCSGLGVLQPRHARDALDGVRRSAVEAACASLGPCMWIRRAATRLSGQPSSLWGLTAQLLAALHAPAERSVLPLSMATDSSQFPAWQQHPNRPHEFLPPQTPSRRWRHSALARWRCTTTSARRFVPCHFHWWIEAARLAPHFSHDTAESHAA